MLIIPLIITALDIFIKINTAIYIEGNLILDRKVIFRNYINNFIWKDTLAIICLIISFFNIDYLLIYLIKITNLKEIF